MPVSKELLEYQQVDGELRKIEQEVAASEERKKYMQAKKFLETADEKLKAQDKRARDLRVLSERLTKEFGEIEKEIADYSDLDEMVESGGDIGFYKKSVQSLLDRLRALKAELSKLSSDIDGAVEEYRKMKKQTIQMQKQYKEYSEKFKEVKNSRAEEVKEINARLQKIGANIPPAILAGYQAKRKEKIFPVVAPLTNGRCVCGMDFALAQQNKLSDGGVIECEHCRRYIYKA